MLPFVSTAPAAGTRPVRRYPSAQQTLDALLRPADVCLNGDRSWDVRVHHEGFYARVLSGGTLALGESYMDGWWDCDALDEMVARVVRADLHRTAPLALRARALLLSAVLMNRQHSSRAFEVGRRHYDLGNDLFEAMLDARMAYSCGYWRQARTLEEAQEAKLDLICRKIELRPGQHVLDIGCGWGSFARYAAEHYGARVTGITISQEQAVLARERCQGLPVEIRLQDYRAVDEPFDHIVSVGMFEHVGHKNHRAFMEMARRCLREEGLMLLHTIVRNESRRASDPWIDRYIFPNGLIPSPRQIATAAEGVLLIEDVHNFGADYDRTLMTWAARFEEAWPWLRSRYDERFYRMWTYYLRGCAGTFRARSNHLWQVVLSARGRVGGYLPVR